MTFLEAKKIVEGKGYHVVKNSEGESFRQRVAREELEEAKRIAEEAGYQLIREDEEIEDDDELDEGAVKDDSTIFCTEALKNNTEAYKLITDAVHGFSKYLNDIGFWKK